MQNKNSSYNSCAGNYAKITKQEIKLLFNKTKLTIIFACISALLIHTIACHKVYAQTTNVQQDPFSWEIKSGDIDPEFLQKWNWNYLFDSLSAGKEVRVIYLVPSNKAIRNDYKAALSDAVLNLQDFYKRELGNNRTFSLHSPVIEVYQTSNPASWYSTNPSRPTAPQSNWFWENALNDGFALTGGRFNDPNNRWVYFIDADTGCGQIIGGNAGVALMSANDLRGLVGEQNISACPSQSPDNGGRNRWIGGFGHELAHTFNVPHPPGCGGGSPNYGCTGGALAANSIMWVGYASYPNTYFLEDDKRILLNSGFFSQPCAFNLNPTAQNFSSVGGTASFMVNTGDGCPWGPVSNNSWITITGVTTGNGSAPVSYSVAANNGPNRTGTITAGGQTFVVAQAGICTYSVAQIGVSTPEISENGGTRSFSVTTQAGCQWTASSNVPWITVASGNSGSGNGTVILNFASNPGASRSGSVTIAGQTLSFFQLQGSSGCSFSIGQGTNSSEQTAFQNAYNTGGGQSVLGCATDMVRFDGFTSYTGTIGHYQTTTNGRIEYLTNNNSAGQAYSMLTPFVNKRASFGLNSNNFLGYPVGFVSQTTNSCLGTQNRSQPFEGGMLVQHLSGAGNGQLFEVHGSIVSKYKSLGTVGCPLGLPISDELDAPSRNGGVGGKYNAFEGGRIYFKHGHSQAYEVHGSINTVYVSLGGSASWLGFPISDEFFGTNNHARSNFEDGYITTLDGINYQAFPNGGNPPRRTLFDFNGDGKTDYGTAGFFRGISAQQQRYWYISINGTNESRTIQFGLLGDREVPADYDGDGKTDIAVFRGGDWYWLRSSDNTFHGTHWGAASDIPVPADYDGDGKAELAVFRQGNWYFLNILNNQGRGIQWGVPSDKPVPADYDGDGKTDVAVFRNGVWYWLQSSTNTLGAAHWGLPSDKLVPADYDGDGKANPAVYRNGNWYIYLTQQSYRSAQLGGNTNDKPTVGDYDGDGKADISIWRPETATFQFQSSNTNQIVAFPFGQSNEIPIASAYVP